MRPNECQYPSLKNIAEGNAQSPLLGRLRLFVRNRLGQRQRLALRRYAYSATTLWGRVKGKTKPVTIFAGEPLQTGDWVRVRLIEEIMSTLDSTKRLKGCSFMTTNGMDQYCGTIQRVLQPMTRFIDECDMRSLKKCNGLVLLDGVLCKGGTILGRCDRGCFMFWRQEWLEKLNEPSLFRQDQVSGRPTRNEKAALTPNSPAAQVQDRYLQAGDLVRVRTKEEIKSTLDNEGKLKGSCFMDVMAGYCDTVHRVLQPMTRFIDEEDGCTAKLCSGLFLLENVMCSGETSLGRCDRSCLLFWREEWLEKLKE